MFNKLISYASIGISAVAARYRGDIGEPSSIGTYQVNVDNSTYANADMIHTTHYHVDWKVDFSSEQLIGSITHDLEVLTDTNILVMDTWGNIISSVEMLHPGSAKCMRDQCSNDIIYSGYPLTWSVDAVNPIIGDQLTINFPQYHKAGESLSVRIWYATSQDSQAMSWLKPSQTSGGLLPYVYTQCEDINCRSVAPLMDTPSNRVTYSARVIHSNQLVAKMSANETIVEKYNGTHSQTRFRCDIPIPNYLMALAVGDLVYRSTGYRTGVISEPSQIDAIASELEDMGELLDMVEAYAGDYIWGNYTIIILPPSFPMGGMENPLLTFASPTIIVGDKSQVYVATHEMAHSWTGNTITCSNWESFWLNEGWTVFIERKVSAALYGEDFALVEAFLGNNSLWTDMVANGGEGSTYASLHPVLKGDNPDNSFSEVPYEKGFQLLTYLNSLIGDMQMQSFLQYYLEQNFLTSIQTIDFRNTWEKFIELNFDGLQTNQILAAVDWEAWMYESTLAPEPLNFHTSEADVAAQLARDYVALNGTASPANKDVYFGFYSNLKVVFYDTLQSAAGLNLKILERIDADYHSTDDPDPEVKQRWLPTGLVLGYLDAYDPAHEWVSSMGRCKYLTSVYVALQSSGQHDLGVKWFNENLDFYHPVAITTVSRDLGLTSETKGIFIE